MVVALKEGQVSVISVKEARIRWSGSSFWYEMENLLRKERMHFSKAEVLVDMVLGEVIWHPSKGHDRQQICIVFYLDKEELVLVGDPTDGDHWKQKINRLAGQEDDLSPVRFFLRMLDELLKDDGKQLQRLETTCFRLEEALGEGEDIEPMNLLTRYRRILLSKSFQFQQMMDMSDSLADNVNDFFDDKEIQCLQTFGKKVERLHHRTAMLRDYMIQIMEWKRQQMEQQKDRTMRILTLVTTIFFPLTVITGWYGMNFEHMPELGSRYGYLLVAIVCLVIVAGEIFYFHRKKLL